MGAPVMNKTVKFFQKLVFHAQNSYEPKHTPAERTLDDGRILLNDIRYGTQYPNSYLDVYLSPVEAVKHPTLIYVHGGGYTWGKKEDYSVTTSNKGIGRFFSGLSRSGYHIVSIDYAFAPEHLYPTPILQLTEAVSFLKSNPKLGLDLSSVSFGGDSAGGQMIGQFINIQINDDYARELDIPQVLPKDSIKAAVFFSGLLDLEKFGVTHSKVTDKLFSKCGYAYFNTDRLEGNRNCIQASVIEHAASAFPPSFLSDGNTGSFYDQARSFSEKLTRLGVRNELLLHPIERVKLGHGYETADSPQAVETQQRAIDFLKSVIQIQ